MFNKKPFLNSVTAKLALAAVAMTVASPAAFAAVVCASPAITITNSIDGIYFNLVTGVSGVSGTAVPGWDINPYNNGAGLTFYGSASPAGVLATGTAGTSAVAQAVATGAAVSPTPATGFYNQFQTVGTNFQSAGTRFLGVKFLNETTSVQNYGWIEIISGASTGTSLGFPATLNRFCYDNTGAAINAGTTPVALQKFSVD